MLRCAAHNAETSLRCGKCDKPICPDCLVIGPAGARCRECAAIRSSPLFQVPGNRLALGIVAGLAAGTLGGYVVAAARHFGFMLFWIGLFAGTGIGEAVLRAVKRKRGPKVELTAGAGATVGSIVGIGLLFAQHHWPAGYIGPFLGGNLFLLVGLGTMVFSAISRTRFF